MNKLEDLKEEVNDVYHSEAVDNEVIARTEIGMAFIKIEEYISELEQTVNNLKKQIK